jgi:SET domain-containing protein
MSVAVRPSPIHGRGLFATTDIPQSTPIVEYLGRRISKSESISQCARGNTFVVALDDITDLDGDVPENLARFANHSCEPNCELTLINDRLWLVASRRIEAGEELTIDYGYDPTGFRDEPCRCGSARCVGFIVAEPYQDSVRRLMAAAAPQ